METLYNWLVEHATICTWIVALCAVLTFVFTFILKKKKEHSQNISDVHNSTINQAGDFILSSPFYSPSIHHKEYVFARPDGHTTTYESLPIYIRNCIDHPDGSRSYTDEEFETLIKRLIDLLK